MSRNPSRYLVAAAAAIVLAGLVLVRVSAAAQVAVDAELERLAAANGFEVTGLEHTRDAFGRADAHALYPRLRQLLARFNSVIVQGPSGGIDRVIILGPKEPYEPPQSAAAPDEKENAAGQPKGDLVVNMVRRGTSHAVEVSLEGTNGQRIRRSLVVDTGADLVVLPASLAGPLGMAPGALLQRQMQTANGRVTARIGKLPAIWMGDRRIPDVEAAFVEDTRLGENALLGMSVLGRYRMTIDDEHGLLTLGSK